MRADRLGTLLIALYDTPRMSSKVAKQTFDGSITDTKQQSKYIHIHTHALTHAHVQKGTHAHVYFNAHEIKARRNM